MVYQSLNRDARATKTRRAAHDFRIDLDDGTHESSCELSVEEASESGGMRQGGRWRFDTLFDGDLERAFQSELNFARRFLARVAVCHDTGPFDNLGDEAFVTFFRRIPNPDFIVARVGLHGCLHH